MKRLLTAALILLLAAPAWGQDEKAAAPAQDSDPTQMALARLNDMMNQERARRADRRDLGRDLMWSGLTLSAAATITSLSDDARLGLAITGADLFTIGWAVRWSNSELPEDE